MPPGKLDPSVLLALGLVAVGCGDKEDDTDTGPCLSPTPEDTGDTGDTGPCLDYAGDSRETTSPAAALAAAPPSEESREAATARVLERGVLPDDVAALLLRKG